MEKPLIAPVANGENGEKETRFPTIDTFNLENLPQFNQKHLVNRINCCHFHEQQLRLYFRHQSTDKIVSFSVEPQPCLKDQFDAVWSEVPFQTEKLKGYELMYLLVPDDVNLLLARAEPLSIGKRGITLMLPETCALVSSRKAKRYPCHGISVRLTQNNTSLSGTLIDFNAISFAVKVRMDLAGLALLNPDLPLHVSMAEKEETFYASEGKVIRRQALEDCTVLVIQTCQDHIQRFRPKEFRSTRQTLVPAPDVLFVHPVTKGWVNLKVHDISGSGFSVLENENRALLLPGMILPEVEISFAQSLTVKCSAQVFYRQKLEAENAKTPMIKCGLAILDMDLEDHLKLTAILHQADDRGSYISNRVNLDVLWDFFFETGFIYPEKYIQIAGKKETLKEVYERFYSRSPRIARHFIYQRNGRILGHMSMIRFYSETWMIQHHAAKSSEGSLAGIAVLNQVGRFTNESHRIRSVHMKYLICFYQPNNKFPRKVFGGVSETINDLKGCSVDPFAYFHYRRTFQTDTLTGLWELVETERDDLILLNHFYERKSGGLVMRAMDLDPTAGPDLEGLSREFDAAGFARRRTLFSLKKNGRLVAVFVVNISDFGLNLSDLTNSITTFIVNPEYLNKETFLSTLAEITAKTGQTNLPVLVFPFEAMDSFAFEKVYNLWVLNLEHTDSYFRYLKRLIRFIKF